MPGYWMNEGGQSSTGQVRGADIDRSVLYAHYTAQLIHFITTTHPAYPGLVKIVKEGNSSAHEGPSAAPCAVDDLWNVPESSAEQKIGRADEIGGSFISDRTHQGPAHVSRPTRWGSLQVTQL